MQRDGQRLRRCKGIEKGGEKLEGEGWRVVGMVERVETWWRLIVGLRGVKKTGKTLR